MGEKQQLKRRGFVSNLLAFFTGLVTLPSDALGGVLRQELDMKEQQGEMDQNPIISIRQLGFQWETMDPFLFCVHHEDHFPKGNDQMGPDEVYFKGRKLGDDFIIKDGFRMYHGSSVPGFPGHPHRGFETVTIVRKGIVDHSDSLGAAGRYGNGDVQWMTAGKGVQHAEMFPLVHNDKDNPLELFQIWLNLPRSKKMVEPHFKMLWKESIPIYKNVDGSLRNTTVEVIAGKLNGVEAQAPAPDSWAADPHNEVGIWNIKMDSNTSWTLPAASMGVNRTLYFYEGSSVWVNEKEVSNYSSIVVKANMALEIKTGGDSVSILVLQGRPINEPVIQYGPFVMNTKAEIHEAFDDFHQTEFGGWPWDRYDQVHDRNKLRFAKHADGSLEEKDSL